MLAVLHTSQILRFNRGIQRSRLQGAVGAGNAGLNATRHDSSDMDPVGSVLRTDEPVGEGDHTRMEPAPREVYR